MTAFLLLPELQQRTKIQNRETEKGEKNERKRKMKERERERESQVV